MCTPIILAELPGDAGQRLTLDDGEEYLVARTYCSRCCMTRDGRPPVAVKVVLVPSSTDPTFPEDVCEACYQELLNPPGFMCDNFADLGEEELAGLEEGLAELVA